jgi:hypothetical protein
VRKENASPSKQSDRLRSARPEGQKRECVPGWQIRGMTSTPALTHRAG